MSDRKIPEIFKTLEMRAKEKADLEVLAKCLGRAPFPEKYAPEKKSP